MSILHMGLDVGSTTVKLVILNSKFELLHGVYKRHFSDIKETIKEIVLESYKYFKNERITIMVTGSGGLSVTKWLDISFVQEVVASTKSIDVLIPETDVAIELGGEDAKITYLGTAPEQRMNSICAGGTGAFIDQMASLLETDAKGLNNLSKAHKKVYSIASRCGVFAKTDVQSLINQGVSKEDISISVFQAVVNQTISNLACGRPIRGKVAFLGGPLHFLSGLRERFKKTLNLEESDMLYPENSQLYVAIGAGILSAKEKSISFKDFKNRLDNYNYNSEKSMKSISPLFKDEGEYMEFKKRHEMNQINLADKDGYKGIGYLGIDAGSTTTKAVVLNENSEILYTYYGGNKGKPMEQAVFILKEVYKKFPDIEILNSCVTGYGEEFIKEGLNIDEGEVETMAHYKGAQFFESDVDFILDIGGQDMKSIKIQDGVINEILLNEACSSGCGSFIQTFAKSLNMEVSEFLDLALFAKHPVDLGSRCTVFMNSCVKQAQKEGSTVGDIAAGLSYSVIKNALQKVIKCRDPEELGKKIVVQGGTFYGDAILRSFELISGREVIRPNFTGLIGAIGSALIAKEKYTGRKSHVLTLEQLNNFSYTSVDGKCGRCSNNCMLTINEFSNGKKYITGNRCERGIGIEKGRNLVPNLYEYKYKRTFNYKSLDLKEAKRGVVGIPRVLNIYENYPFWHTFFTQLGFSVVLSKGSSRKVYEKGLESIPSETACYPAKMVHGHIIDLIEKGVEFIFYPSVFYEKKEDINSDNHLNCPVVTGYTEVIKHNIEELNKEDILFLNPFITFENKKHLRRQIVKSLKSFSIEEREIDRALKRAFVELENYREDIKNKGREALEFIEENKIPGIVLGGRPYHIDPAINHGIPELINSLDIAVLTEDSVESFGNIDGPLRVLDQWTYHSRIYRAASFVSSRDDVELIQLNSFGCGLDAVVSDQVHEILQKKGKIYTQLKIDEVSNLGAAKIRIRSLLSALEERKNIKIRGKEEELYKREVFIKEYKKTHTILMPQMAPIQFKLLEKVFNDSGYNLEIVDEPGEDAINEGLKYVNNDACYPSILVIGQFINALKSGKYDVDHTALLISQTGGVCRASNYVGFLRKALKDSGFKDVPVIGVSTQGIEKNPGFKFSYNMAKKSIFAILLGDLLTRVSLKTRPYEKIVNSTEILLDNWIEILREKIGDMTNRDFIKYVDEIVESFDRIEILSINKPKVGIVGEILVKYHPAANNDLIKLLEEEGAEVVISDLTDFLLYCLYNSHYKYLHLGKKFTDKLKGDIGINYIEHFRKYIRNALNKSQRFEAPPSIKELTDYAQELISLGNQSGEGWLLTAEMIELIHMGAENIVCVQPFGCLPNHIVGKGMIKPIRDRYPIANIIPLDYDPGASKVNQLNRIKLMMSKAYDNLDKKEKKIELEEKLVN